LLEASDYLAYAVLQQLIDPSSQKAAITASILKSQVSHSHVTKENAEVLLNMVFGNETEIPTMNRTKKQYILSKIAQRE
jgi:hypothetical protein